MRHRQTLMVAHMLTLRSTSHLGVAFLPTPHKLQNTRIRSSFLRLSTSKQSQHDFTANSVQDASSLFLSDPASFYSDMDACWRADSWNINPTNEPCVDCILQGVNSPAPQSLYVLQRAIQLACTQKLRLEKDKKTIQEEVAQRCGYLIKPGYTLAFQRHKLECNSTNAIQWRAGTDWTVLPCSNMTNTASFLDAGWTISTLTKKNSRRSVARIADEMLSTLLLDTTTTTNSNINTKGFSSTTFVQSKTTKTSTVHTLMQEIMHQLFYTLGTDLRGRTAADTAFTLALSGVGLSHAHMYDILVHVATLEMQRVGRRPSRSSRDILHVVEKLAAAGLCPTKSSSFHVQALHRVAADILEERQEHIDLVSYLRQGSYNLLGHSPRPKLWLWRTASRWTKCQPPPESTPKTSTTTNHRINLAKLFQNTTRPLVVELGCGFGVSLLGLASIVASKQNDRQCQDFVPWHECNFLGCDLHPQSISYAQSVAERWNLTSHLQYVCASAEEVVQNLLHLSLQDNGLEAPVAAVLLQFPTPYRLPSWDNEENILETRGGNSQLPTQDAGFMASMALMNSITQLLRATAPVSNLYGGVEGCSAGYLILQSNCEDVAVTMQQWAVDQGLVCVPAKPWVKVPFEKEEEAAAVVEADGETSKPIEQPREVSVLSKRTQKWIRQGGPRAVGRNWSKVPLLPTKPNCATETEMALQVEGKPVHRCLLVAQPPSCSEKLEEQEQGTASEGKIFRGQD